MPTSDNVPLLNSDYHSNSNSDLMYSGVSIQNQYDTQGTDQLSSNGYAFQQNYQQNYQQGFQQQEYQQNYPQNYQQGFQQQEYPQNYQQGFQQQEYQQNYSNHSGYNNQGGYNNNVPSAPSMQKIDPNSKIWEVLSPNGDIPNFPMNQRPDYIPIKKKSGFNDYMKMIFKHTGLIITSIVWYILFTCLLLGIALFFVIGPACLGIFIPSLVFLIFTSIIYWVCVCLDPSAKYLKKKLAPTDSRQYIDSLKMNPPRIWVKFISYHYETRLRTVHYTDGQGRQQSRLETYTERVNTYTETIEFPYSYWVDVSGIFRLDANLAHKKFIKLKLDKKIIFNDQVTADSYLRMIRNFREANLYRDSHHELIEGMDIPNYSGALLVGMGKKQPPVINFSTYLALAIIPGIIIIPYLIFFDSLSGEQNFTLFKRVSLTPFVDGTQSNQHSNLVDINDVNIKEV